MDLLKNYINLQQR